MAWRSLFHAQTCWRAQADRPTYSTPADREAEFLPAVLEIQESPPSPISRAIAFTIIGIGAATFLWATCSRLDIVAVAHGKVVPSGRTKVIQPLESGVIRAIHVQDGQTVNQGQVLIELDSTAPDADRARLRNEYHAAQVDAARLRALITGQNSFDSPVEVDPQFMALQRQVLRDQEAEHRARVEAARRLIDQRKAALDATKENIHRLEATVPIEAERAKAYRQLLAQQYVSKMDYLQFEQQRIDRAQELAAQKRKLTQDHAALEEAEQSFRAFVSEFQRARQTELAAAETKAASLAQELIKAEQRTGLQTLISPIDGVVQQLVVHTVGGVVTPAQHLMIVVPREAPLEVEAWIDNKDIGFVKAGQPAQIKVETFPFTIYGLVEGRVVSVSNDAVPQENAALLYAARLAMAHTTMQVEQHPVNLVPGMAVMVEIHTGTRRVIEYFLSPLLKGLTESIRER